MLKHECAVDTNGLINRHATGREHKDTMQKHGEHKQRMGHILEIFSGQSQQNVRTYHGHTSLYLLALLSLSPSSLSMTSTVPAGSLSCVYSDVVCPRSKSLGCLSHSHYSEMIKPQPISLSCTCVICTEYVCVTTDLFTNLYTVQPFLCMVQAVEAAPPQLDGMREC